MWIAVISALIGPMARAQSAWRDLPRPSSEATDRLRLQQLAGDTASLDATVLRSPSLLSPRDRGERGWQFHLIRPDAQLVLNSAISFGPNLGVLWPERGLSVRFTPGVEAQRGRFRVILAPDFWVAANEDRDYAPRLGSSVMPSPPVARWGNGFADPWYTQRYSADVPWRNGDKTLNKVWLGQTGAWYDTGPVEIGVTTENLWWGPGIQNAILMSDNAAGVPRIELRTPRPWRTRAGAFQAQWFVGALYESQYFDTTKTDDRRSLAAAVVTWRPVFQPSLTLGAARAVFATAERYRDIPTRWLDIFAATGRPSDRALSDSSVAPGGRDQLFSLFARWVFPADGFEFYTEWARQELPRSLHDLIVEPTHTHGYTVGLQYRQPVPISVPAYRVQFEMTSLDPSAPRRDRPGNVFYTSPRVIQGYTNFGKTIGAAIGPGASSQSLAVDRVWPTGAAGVTLDRIRWNEGVRALHDWPGFIAYCNQDVSIIPGLRGGHSVAGGYVSAHLQFATRFNYHFQNVSGCFGPSDDVHNTTLSVSFSPFHH